MIMFSRILEDHIQCLRNLGALESDIARAGQVLSTALANGRKVLVCGNGGSAADAQHFAAELIGRFEQERAAMPAIALTTDSSILTAVGNDYGYADVFSRQVAGLGREGDVLIGISTSGNSENILRAAAEAKRHGLTTIGLLGRDGGRLKTCLDIAVVIPHQVTARIQEAHIFILHFWAALIEKSLTEKK